MGFLRFLLALIVVVHHIPQIPGNKSFPLLMGYLDAMVAVLIFYIFSGFYMSLVINRKYIKAPHFPGSFYANRVLRIFPLYWLMLLLTYIYYVTARHGDRLASISSQHGFFWFGQVFMNITTLGLDIVPSLGGYTLQLIGPAWSLGSEWLFYLLAPWLVRLSMRRTIVLIAVIFAIRFSLYQFGYDRYPLRVLFFPLSLGFFMLGHLAYLIMVLESGAFGTLKGPRSIC
jgi:peptidoglycan/LPS O-acetylase OafA/YrhL